MKLKKRRWADSLWEGIVWWGNVSVKGRLWSLEDMRRGASL